MVAFALASLASDGLRVCARFARALTSQPPRFVEHFTTPFTTALAVTDLIRPLSHMRM
jgi:hypothetical protein